MICPNCKGSYFTVLLDLGNTNSPTQILTEKDVLTCDNCGIEYTLGELTDEQEPLEGN